MPYIKTTNLLTGGNMKKLTLIFAVILFTGLLFAQEVADTTIRLDMGTKDFATPWQIALDAGDKIQFKTTGGEFAILILNAYEIFENDEANVTILLNSDSPESQIYTLKRVEADIVKMYYIYCITNNTWVEAPPKIILDAR